MDAGTLPTGPLLAALSTTSLYTYLVLARQPRLFMQICQFCTLLVCKASAKVYPLTVAYVLNDACLFLVGIQ